jgi:BolA protein
MTENFVSDLSLTASHAGPVAAAMQQELEAAFNPTYLRFENESNNHGGPATDSHFKLILVASAFAELRAVQRHQLVYKLLESYLEGPVHALSLHLFTSEEWAEKEGGVAESPICLGGSKGA